MVITADKVLSETLGLLNDLGQAIYVDTAMYPLMNKAYRELQNKLTAHGIGSTKEMIGELLVPAGTLSLVDGDGILPSDLILPKYLKERANSSSYYQDMFEQDWEPLNLPAKDYIGYWVWREDQIKLSPSTTDRLVLIKYVKGLPGIIGANSVVQILNSEQWLAQRTAILAALVIGGNPSRSVSLAADLSPLWDDLIITAVKKKQVGPVRRKRTRYHVW